MSLTEHSLAVPAEHEKNICGQFDAYMKKIERSLRVTVVSRDGMLKIVGPEEMVDKAEKVIRSLLELSMRGSTITEQNVDYTLALVFDEKQDKIVELDDEVLCRTINGKPVKPKTLGQKDYVDAIDKHMITFGIGPAGTGKTYLAMAMAVKAFKNDEVSRIIMTRPAIEAGEKLGFLPGDLQSKVDPYLRPLYDALYQMMGAEATIANMEKGLFEVAPLAYMRGRTLDNAFIILDEAQNTTSAQMKMFLTRIGFGSKVVVTGDATQRDLDPNLVSGLDTARKILRNVEGISFIELTAQDIVRHPLVQKIVEAYEAYEKKEADRVKNRQERRREQFGDSRRQDQYGDSGRGNQYGDGGRRDSYGDGSSRRDFHSDGRRDERQARNGYPGQGRGGNRT